MYFHLMVNYYVFSLISNITVKLSTTPTYPTSVALQQCNLE